MNKEISKGKALKKLYIIFITMMCLSLTGCSELFKLLHDSLNSDNPLSGKDTDERIIMCLESAYPGHTFSVVEPFDKKADSGTFCDENGIEFSVHSLLYDNVYHFGCEDDYLATLLENESFVLKANDIASKYGCHITESGIESGIIDIEPLQDSLNDYTFKEYAQMVSEVLNVVDVPEVVGPETTEFSTGVINYYTRPCMSILTYYPITYKDSKTAAKFYFEDKDLSVEQLEQRFEDTLKELQSWVDE